MGKRKTRRKANKASRKGKTERPARKAKAKKKAKAPAPTRAGFGYRVYFTDRTGGRVIRWDPDTDVSEVVAGEPKNGDPDQRLRMPYGLAVDTDGNLLIADKLNDRICRLKGGRVETVRTRDAEGHRAGVPVWQQHSPVSPTGIWVEESGTLLCTYSDENTIYRVHPDGGLELVLGIPPNRHHLFAGYEQEAPASEAGTTPVRLPTSVVGRSDGTVFFIERGYQAVREYHPERGLRGLFPMVLQKEFRKVRRLPEKAPMGSYHPVYPSGLALDADGRLYMADSWHGSVLLVDLAKRRLRLVMETPVPPERRESGPSAITFGPDGVLWVVDRAEGCVHGFKRTRSGPWRDLGVKLDTAVEGQPCGADGGTGIVCGR